MKTFLAKIEPLFMPNGPYIFGSRVSPLVFLAKNKALTFSPKVTWADAFLYPLIADLLTVPEGTFVSTRILKWVKSMELVGGVQKTFDGTLAARGRP